jgi:hypothetical protein
VSRKLDALRVGGRSYREDGAFSIEEAAQIVAWRYGLGVTETLRYFGALDGFRPKQ